MVGRKRKAVIIGLCLIFIIGLGFIIYKIGRESNGWKWVKDVDNIDDILYLEVNPKSGNKCVVTEAHCESIANNILLDGYVYTCNFEYEWNLWRRNAIKIKSSQVDVYDLVTRKKVKSYDLESIVEQYAPDTSWNGNVYIYQKENSDLYFQLWTCGEYAEEDKDIYINFTTDEITILNRGDEFKEVEEANEIFLAKSKSSTYFIVAKDEIGLMKANGFSARHVWEEDLSTGCIYMINSMDMGYWCIRLTKDTLPKENSILYTEFPGLKGYQGADNDLISIYISGDISAEEILSMLIEEGEEISFEGCVLPAESSIDGKEHEIHSFEEYEQWKKYEDQ